MPLVKGLSPLAVVIPERLKDVADRTADVFGFCIHQTGSGLVEQAAKHGADLLNYAVSYYLQPESYFAHYVCGYDGTVVQLANELERAPHVGLSSVERASYLDGSWKAKLPQAVVDQWVRQWGSQYKSPAHLFPGASVNNVYVGIEMLPLLDPYPGAAFAGSRYTVEQHDAVAALAADVAGRWSFPKGWAGTGRLATHEALNPFTRSDKQGGWDPGAMRQAPWFDLGWIAEQASKARP